MKIIDRVNKWPMLKSKIEKLGRNNKAFFELVRTIDNSSLVLEIGSEQDLIKDSHNASQTIKEFRSYYLPGKIYLFATRYETDDSIFHLFLHELCHALVSLNPLMHYGLLAATGQYIISLGKELDIKSDFWTTEEYENIIKGSDIHDLLPEEKLCDSFASSLVGFKYDRSWWMSQWEQVYDEE